MEQERVYGMFNQSFQLYKDVPMALYGLGINTKYLLEAAEAYNIIGIAAKDRIGEYVYGKPVMSIESVMNKVKIIVIVAHMQSVKIIYNRIKFVEDNGINIYDIYGRRVKDYLGDESSWRKDDPYWAMNYTGLLAEIDRHDSIYFQLFDTLITGKILRADGVGSDESVSDMEGKHFVKRRIMIEALEHARLQGKEVYILADEHLNTELIHELYLQYSIPVRNVIVKGNSLYIGSDSNYIEMAAKAGIDTFYLMGPYEMLLKSSIAHVIPNASSIYDYTVLGLFTAKAFNDPFALSESKGKLRINNMYELGYYCFAPITLRFLAWICGKLDNACNSVILFSSRDGYLLCRLYQHLKEKNPNLKLPEAVYFYISRRAATVACIRTEADIADIVESVLRLSMGNLGEILERRLGIAFEKGDPILDRSLMDIVAEINTDRILDRVMEYKDKILENAASERKNYLKYIQMLSLHAYDNIYLFDLYTKGTGSNRLGRLLNREIKLLCYAVKDYPNEYINDNGNLFSLFDNTDISSGQSFKRSYQLFEAVYSSPEGQLKCFDDDGLPQFIENSGYDHRYINKAQEGITAFINDLAALDEKWYMRDMSLPMMDSMVKIMEQKYSVSPEEIHKAFIFYDSFTSEEVMNIWERII